MNTTKQTTTKLISRILGRRFTARFARGSKSIRGRSGYRRRLNTIVTSVTIFTLLVSILLPIATVRASQTLTWTNSADFAYNKASSCQKTNSDKLAIAGAAYTDATCATVGSASDVSLAMDEFKAVPTTSTSAGSNHSLALRADGTVWAWGYNAYGQLGDATNTQRNVPVQVKDAAGTGFLSGVTAIDAGSNHSLALKTDGTVWAWGGNDQGQLGNGTINTQYKPVQVKDAAGTGFLSGVTAISIGAYYSLALRTDGTVWAWGYNANGQLGDGTVTQRNVPVQVKSAGGTSWLTGVTKITSGQYHSLALKSDGTLWAWGWNGNGQLGIGQEWVVDGCDDGFEYYDCMTFATKYSSVQVAAGSTFSAITAGANHSLALKAGGTVWGWGWNGLGQLGDGTVTLRPTPVQVAAGSTFSAITAGDDHTLAFKADGTLWAWGSNGFGQIGNGTITNQITPVQVKDAAGTGFLSGVTAISGGAQHSLVVNTNGTVWDWGLNGQGQLGDGTVTQRSLPFQVIGTPGTGFNSSASLSGIIVDAGAGRKTKWNNVDWQSVALPASTSIVFNARTSNDKTTWSGWSSSFTQATAGSTSGTGDLSSLPFSRYIELKATLATSNPVVSPRLNDFSLNFMNDTTAPATNASAITIKKDQSGAVINQNAWTNDPTPYFSWTAGADEVGGSGIQGYCLYLGADNTADVKQTKGILGASPVNTDGACQYVVSANNLDLSVAGALATPLATSDQPYYLLVKAIDQTGNVYSGPAEATSLRYDDIPPTNSSFISAPSQFSSTKDVTLTWPTSGAQASADANSGVAGLQYKIGTGGTWYGDVHNGNQDLTDLLANDGSYQTNVTTDYPLLNEGNNVAYFRTVDSAGNLSTSYNTAVIKLNTSSPTSPQNVSAVPPSNTTNSFAFSWNAPASFVGPVGGLTYCYTVNTLPTANTCNYTSPGQTSLSADAFATQPGENIFYVVAKDEAGNINYATYGSATFNANTQAPGIPQNLEIADISTKATNAWKLAFSWAAPADVGAGVSKYAIYRSTTGVTYSQVATTAGLSYVDSSLDQLTHYYKVKACDSANNCGAFSEVISKLPTGRFTEPPELISNPSVEVSTRNATFNWITDRKSDSRVQYGTKSGVYFTGEVAVSEPTKAHTVELLNLEAGTTYYYKAKWMDEDGNIGVSSELSFTTLPAPIVKNVEVIKKTLNSATIQFTSIDASKVSMSYGKSEGFGGLKSINTSRSESSYTIELTGLDDGASYFYKLNTFDSDGNEYDSRRIDTFTTPARPKITDLRFQPISGEPTSTQMVTWKTNVPASSILTYGKVGTNGSDEYLSKLTIEHEIILRGLEDDSQYFLLAQSRDVDGNLAVGDRQIFKTALDTRPPKISGTRVETSIKGNGSEARGQIVISWKTDEPTTGQVAYADGSGGTDYSNKTSEDARLSTDHVVIISDLPTSKVYHLQPISRDKSQNIATGKDKSAIIGRASESILNIILNSLNSIFGI
ncbi:fibronectin type III domain-containing protein [Candidatus Saccharibacteria bacterium]|nr:fibronectin type III domain-containing protein [Candidatus Saccharibacteria bacterium]